MSKKIDLTGQRFGRWRVIEEHGSDKHGKVLWICKCDCGKIKPVVGSDLRSGKSVSCGCFNEEVCTTHKMSKTPLYMVWTNMKVRCCKVNSPQYENYGGRGITVCDRWMQSFENFYEDMGGGYKQGLSIDRINNNDGYCKENCRWATHLEQQNNTRANRLYTVNGETASFSDLCRKYGKNYEKVRYCMRFRGLSIEQALSL